MKGVALIAKLAVLAAAVEEQMTYGTTQDKFSVIRIPFCLYLFPPPETRGLRQTLRGLSQALRPQKGSQKPHTGPQRSQSGSQRPKTGFQRPPLSDRETDRFSGDLGRLSEAAGRI